MHCACELADRPAMLRNGAKNHSLQSPQKTTPIKGHHDRSGPSNEHGGSDSTWWRYQGDLDRDATRSGHEDRGSSEAGRGGTPGCSHPGKLRPFCMVVSRHAGYSS